VTVRFEPPYAIYDYAYTAPVTRPGQLYIELPDSLYAATISVLPIGEGLQSIQPLEFTSAQYWDWMGQRPAGSFLDHTFRISAPGTSKTVSSQPGESKNKSSWPVVIAILGCCCLLILGAAAAGGVLFFVRRSRSKSGGA